MDKHDDDILEDLLDEWEIAEEEGRSVSLEELCKDYPHLLSRLRDKLDQLRGADHLLKSFGKAGTSQFGIQTPNGMIRTGTSFTCSDVLGQGGLGQVFQAKDHELNRVVAIKFLQERHVESKSACRQFEAEAEITSRLDHPGIIPIYGHGLTESGQPFYVMRQMEGESFYSQIRSFHDGVEHRLASNQQVEFHNMLNQFAWICRVIHYAHSRGVIHRDIKPDNIMVGKHGETVVLDWGLAAAVGRSKHHQDSAERTLQLSEERLNQMVARAGTPAYMSPEQFENDELGPETDIYALGVTLYFLLTGETPFSSKHAMPVLKQKVTDGKFQPPKTIKNWVPSALNAVCVKAMSRDPAERYQTAEDFANEIERFLADEPVLAFEEPFVNRAVRWMRRHKFQTQLAGFVIATIVISLLGISMLASSNAREEHEARVAADEKRNQSLQLAAFYAAESVASRMNTRWVILESVPRVHDLGDLLQNATDPTVQFDSDELQNRLLRIAGEYQGQAEPDSWFICDANGRQVARVPTSDRSMWKSYSHRDYFHGNGRDLEKGSTGDPKHISTIHRSKVYVSSSSGKLKVALTAPIWNTNDSVPDRKFLGIIGMSVTLGEFQGLQRGLESNQFAIVVDLETNIIREKSADGVDSEQTYDGLVLHHPAFETSTGLQKRRTIDIQTLEQIQAVRQQLRNNASSNDTAKLSSFRDPFSTTKSDTIAYAAPIFVKGRTEKGDTGWAVLICEEVVDE